jgi:riboflavin transporter FmnP
MLRDDPGGRTFGHWESALEGHIGALANFLPLSFLPSCHKMRVSSSTVPAMMYCFTTGSKAMNPSES